MVWSGFRCAIRSQEPDSHGTRLAATDAGLVLAVLDATADGPPIGGGRPSRGQIIPAVLPAGSPLEAIRLVERILEGAAFAPFRFVAIGPHHIAGIWWDGARSAVESQLIGGRPAVFTTPGSASDRGADARTSLFREMLAGPPSGWPAAQAAYHRHRWPDRLEESVNMIWADARTVSYTTVERGDGGVRITYHPDAPHMPAEDTVCDLPYAGGWWPPAGHRGGQ